MRSKTFLRYNLSAAIFLMLLSVPAQSKKEFSNLTIVNHPLIQHKLTLIRKKNTSPTMFRQLVGELGMLIGYAATQNLPTKLTTIQTPLASTKAPVVEQRVVIVPILRAGLGLSDGLSKIIPTATAGHIGLYRDHKTKLPVEYLVKLPPNNGQTFIIVDPMLATGNTASRAVDILVRHGIPKSNIIFMALVAAPEGIRSFNKQHSAIPIYTAALDSHLDSNAYIVPGLGDAGDRLFGTN